MEPNVQPIYTRSVIHDVIKLSNQAGGRELGTNIPVRLCEGGKNGSLIWGIRVQPLGTVTAHCARFFSKRENIADYQFLFEQDVAAVTASDNVAIASTHVVLPDLLPAGKGFHLEPAETLWAVLSVAQTPGVNIEIRGGDY